MNQIARIWPWVAVFLLMGRGILHAEQPVVTVTNYVAEAALPTVGNMMTVVSNGTTRVALTAPAQQVSTNAIVVTPLDTHGNVEVRTPRSREVVNPYLVKNNSLEQPSARSGRRRLSNVCRRPLNQRGRAPEKKRSHPVCRV